MSSEVVLPLKWLCHLRAYLEASAQNLQTFIDHFAAFDSCEGIISEKQCHIIFSAGRDSQGSLSPTPSVSSFPKNIEKRLL